MKKLKWKGWMIGGIVGFLIGLLFNLKGTLLFSAPIHYGYASNPIIWIIFILFGVLFGFLYEKFKRQRILFSGLIGGVLSFMIVINSSENFTIGGYIFEKIIFYPFGNVLHTFATSYALILIVIQWTIIGALFGYLFNKLKK